MNILFIEDEPALLASGVEQLELLGHTVYPAVNLELARTILKNPVKKVHLVIADHALPDGRGVDFAVQVQEERPDIHIAIVSGCLTDKDRAILDFYEIRYHAKPLLYRKVIDEIKRERMERSPVASGKSTLGAAPAEAEDGGGSTAVAEQPEPGVERHKDGDGLKGRFTGLFRKRD